MARLIDRNEPPHFDDQATWVERAIGLGVDLGDDGYDLRDINK